MQPTELFNPSNEGRAGREGPTYSPTVPPCGTLRHDDLERTTPAVKVVLFCGGLGLRMGTLSHRVPKPMVRIGGQPILWHIMSLYASYGFRDFLLCMGHRAEVIQRHFARCDEVRSGEWAIEFADTGSHASVGERLRRVAPRLEGEELFLANYGDVLTDAPLDEMIDLLRESGRSAMLLAARPRYNFHVLDVGAGGLVGGIRDVTTTDLRINGGFFVFRREVLAAIREGEDLVEEPFRRLIEADELLAYPHDGFWAPMDTLKDKQLLEETAPLRQGAVATAPQAATGPRPHRGGRMIAAELDLGAAAGCSPSAATPTTSRSAWGGTLLTCASATRRSPSPGSFSAPTRHASGRPVRARRPLPVTGPRSSYGRSATPTSPTRAPS